MNTEKLLPGRAYQGGFHGGEIRIDGFAYAVIVAPKGIGQYAKEVTWNRSLKAIEGAFSYCDGLANTRAMAAGGSKLAEWALGLVIEGYSDWYLPSMDEMEILYRNLKPTEQQNWLYSRSGINLHAVNPTPPYTADSPLQTPIELFKAGAAEAFDPDWYWSSSQHAAYSDFAWCQYFDDGGQSNNRELTKLRARAVRRSPI